MSASNTTSAISTANPVIRATTPIGLGFAWTRSADDGETATIPGADGTIDSHVDLDWWLKFVATANSDFGPATATLRIGQNNWSNSTSGTIVVQEAWVGVGDTTMVMLGYKGSIFNTGDDTPLNVLGLFNSQQVNTGVGFRSADATGGMSIQVVSNVGNGSSIGGGLEHLNQFDLANTTTTPPNANWTAVGVLELRWRRPHRALCPSRSTRTACGTSTRASRELGIRSRLWAPSRPTVPAGGTLWAARRSASTCSLWRARSKRPPLASGVSVPPVRRRSATAYGSISLAVTSPGPGGSNIAQVEAGISAAVTEAITLSGSSVPASDNAGGTAGEPHPVDERLLRHRQGVVEPGRRLYVGGCTRSSLERRVQGHVHRVQVDQVRSSADRIWEGPALPGLFFCA